MTRHGKRGTNGDQGQQEWLNDGYRAPGRDDARTEYRAAAWDNVSRGRRARGAVGTSSDPGSMRYDERGQRWDQTGPPWELPGWDEAAQAAAGGHPSAPLPPARGDDLTGGHPSAPLPRVSGPLSAPTSGPLPAAWPDSMPPASSGPMRRVSSSGPMPRVTSSGPMPRVTESGPMPRVSPSGHMPRVRDSGPMPRVRDSGPMPAPGYDPRRGYDSPDQPGHSVPGPVSRHGGYPRDDDPYQGGQDGYPDGGDQRYLGRHGGEGGYPPSAYPDGGPYSDGGYGQGGGGYSGSGYPAGYPETDGGYADGYGADPPGGAGRYRGEDGYPTEIGYAPGAAYPGQAPPAHDPGYPDGPGYAEPGYPPDGYPPDGYPGGAGYHDGGEYAAQDGYADQGYPPGQDYDYPAEAGYPGASDYAPGEEPYPGYPEPSHDPRHVDDGSGYTGQGDWYGDVDEDQGWADEGYDDGFVPGLGDDRSEPARAGRRSGNRDSGPRGRSAKRKGKSKSKSGVRRAAPLIAVGILFFALCAAGAAYYWVYRNYLHPADYPGAGTGTVQVVVAQNETATAVGQMLFSKGVVASARAFSNAAKDSGRGSALEPGTFTLHLHMKASLAFQMLLSSGARVETKVLLREGLRLSNIIAVLGRDTDDLPGYKKAIGEVSQLGLPAYAHNNPQGFLFPDTYTIQHGTPPLKVLQEMVNAFNQEATKVDLVSQANKGNITPAEVITIASLVQAEGGRISDYPKIAEVIYNRLNHLPSPMKLQMDSTVLFALHKYGILASNQDLKVKSPYNTYANLGLPPGPIDSPGDAAIQAALHPAHGTLLYFVTVDPKNRITKFTSDPQVFAQLKAELEKNLAK
jgi:UPF0755 protein